MEFVKNAIGILEARHGELARQMAEIEQAIEVVLALDPQENKEPKTAEAPRRTRQARRTGKKKRAGKAGATTGGKRKRFSKYKGVYESKPAKDGTLRYKACARIDGKNKEFGTFKVEREAALAAAKARGDTELVRELTDETEQANNNPDRPLGRRGSRKSRKPAYKCLKCGLSYTTKPISCPQCSGAGFREV